MSVDFILFIKLSHFHELLGKVVTQHIPLSSISWAGISFEDWLCEELHVRDNSNTFWGFWLFCIAWLSLLWIFFSVSVWLVVGSFKLGAASAIIHASNSRKKLYLPDVLPWFCQTYKKTDKDVRRICQFNPNDKYSDIPCSVSPDWKPNQSADQAYEPWPKV